MKGKTVESRYRIYAVSEQRLVDLWNCLIDPGDREREWRGHGLQGHLMPMLKAEGIPEGSVVDGVHHDWMTRTVRFRVWNESFDIVPDGELPPVVSDAQTGVALRVVLSEVQTMVVRHA